MGQGPAEDLHKVVRIPRQTPVRPILSAWLQAQQQTQSPRGRDQRPDPRSVRRCQSSLCLVPLDQLLSQTRRAPC